MATKFTPGRKKSKRIRNDEELSKLLRKKSGKVRLILPGELSKKKSKRLVDLPGVKKGSIGMKKKSKRVGSNTGSQFPTFGGSTGLRKKSKRLVDLPGVKKEKIGTRKKSSGATSRAGLQFPVGRVSRKKSSSSIQRGSTVRILRNKKRKK